MFLLANVEFTTEGITVIGTLFAALASAIAVLWRTDAARRDDQIADLKRQRDDLLRLVLRNNLHDSIPPSVPPSALPPSPPPRM